MDRPVPASFWRGGTSRAVLFRADDLREFEPEQVEAIILAALGSPDPDGRQIDGLGGGISSLSKAAIVGPAPSGSDADAAFRFAQVEVAEPRVDFAGNCGNISAAIAPFAVNEGLAPASGSPRHPAGSPRHPAGSPRHPAEGRDPAPGATADPVEVDVVVLNLNTGQRFATRVPVSAGRYDPSGDFAIGGVPGTGARLTLEYLDPDGSIGRGALPTGLVRESVDVPGCGAVPVSIIDVGNPAVFVPAEALGVPDAAAALPAALDADEILQSRLERIRCEAAVRIGLAGSLDDAGLDHRTVPKVALVGAPAAYRTTSGSDVNEADADLVVRLISMGRTHRTLAMTAAMACAAAVAMDGSVVAEVATGSLRTAPAPAGRATPPRGVRLGHPAGVLALNVTAECPSGTWRVPCLTMDRTAREIMRGTVQVPQTYLDGEAWFLPGSSR
ncbi:MAG: PrpF family protein [bacterium]|nr:PrpF family protein [bacterium]